jgi:cytochrome P450
MLSSPDSVRDVFRGDPHLLHSGEGNEFLSVTVGSNSVIVLDDESHARQRRVLLPPLKGQRMRSFFDAMQNATLDAVGAWPLGQPLRMDEPMRQITLRVILQAVLGLVPGPQLDEFQHKVQTLLATTRSRYSLILTKVLPLGLLRKIPRMPYFSQLRELDTAIYALLEKRRREPAEARGDNVVADLLAATHEDDQPLSNPEIRDAVVTLLIAGHETTALALAWALERIVSHADAMERITDELNRATGGGAPGVEHLNQLEYLDAAIRE